MSSNSTLPAELIRALLIVLSILPFLLTAQMSRRRLALWSGLLLFVVGGISAEKGREQDGQMDRACPGPGGAGKPYPDPSNVLLPGEWMPRWAPPCQD